MASKQNGSSIPSPRPPFRRQGSSVGPSPHPMTVALAPVSRIDYSVTKGGARTWAVLFVFLFLCSGLYTIFSSKESSVDLHSSRKIHDRKADDPHDISPLPPDLDTDVSEEDDQEYEESPEADEEATDTTNEYVDSRLEDHLLANLKRKMEHTYQRVQELVKDQKHTDLPEKDGKLERHKKRSMRTKEKKVDKDNNVKENDDEVGSSESEDMHTEQDSIDEDEDRPVENEADDSGNEIVNKTDAVKGQRHRKPRSQVARFFATDAVPERECRRKHCPPTYQAEPRLSLLKTKSKGQSNLLNRNKQALNNHEHEVSEEDEEEIESDEEYSDELDEHDIDVVPLNKQNYKVSGKGTYKRQSITNREDTKNRNLLDQGDALVEKHNYNAAFAVFDSVLQTQPDSPRAHFGKGRGYHLRGEFTSNDIDFTCAIQEYEYVLSNDKTPSALFRQAALRLIELASFRGDFYRCLLTYRRLINRFPEETQHEINVALTFIKMKRFKDAKQVLHNIIENDHANGIALAYYGYILKVDEGNIEQGVANMKKGLRIAGDQITDAKFYYHLGHGLMFLGRSNEAYEVFEHAASLGLFLSAQQRSMYNIEGLTGRAWWSIEQTGYTKHLKAVERQWVSIRAEAAHVLHSAPQLWKEENPTITIDGRWIAFPLLENGHFNLEHCSIVPHTCSILREFRERSNASRSEMRFSALSSGAQILPHCGSTNSRLQAHLGLIAPSEARIRVGNEQRGWKTGKFIIFDDSFEHELQFDGASSASIRLILLIDLWHPEVESHQRSAPKDD